MGWIPCGVSKFAFVEDPEVIGLLTPCGAEGTPVVGLVVEASPGFDRILLLYVGAGGMRSVRFP